MPTVIYFGEGNLAITVSDEPDQVEEAFVESNGRPFKLNAIHGEKLWVNPARIAFWRAASASPRPPDPLALPPPSGRPPTPNEWPPRESRRLALRYERPDQSTTAQIYRLEGCSRDRPTCSRVPTNTRVRNPRSVRASRDAIAPRLVGCPWSARASAPPDGRVLRRLRRARHS